MRTRPKSRAGEGRWVKQLALVSVRAGIMTGQNDTIVTKKEAGSQQLGSTQSRALAQKAQKARQRSARIQRSAICPAMNGASSDPRAWAAQAAPIWQSVKPMSLRWTVSCGRTAPGGA